MKTLIPMSILLATIVFLTYLFSGKMKGKPIAPASLWFFYLIEKIFEENNSSKEEVKENGMSQSDSGQDKNV